MISKNKIKYVHSLGMKKHRTNERVFVAEGRKLVGDLLPFFECVYIAATQQWLDENAHLVPSSVEIDSVTDDELQRVSFVETPQQVLAIFRQPNDETTLEEASKTNLCIALDDVQNPGNLGTIVRLADWFGIEHVFCSKGCADIYNPKTVQATMGALARVHVHYINIKENLLELQHKCPVYGTFLDGDNIYSKQLSQNGVIVMGNEGNGVSAEVEALVDEKLYIPNYPAGRKSSESLNVAIATAVVCAEFRRRNI